jgi:hypothetical protein
MATTYPGGLELCQERIKRTHPAMEHISAGTTHQLTDQPARFIRPPHDLFDRRALGRQRKNRGVLRLAKQSPGMLSALGGT